MAKLMVLIALVIISLVGITYGSGYGYAGVYPVIAGGYGGKGIGGYGGGRFGGGYSSGGIGGILQFIFPYGESD
ncbi:hypothetical protein CHS0354_004231 [Potamilus streckersoni]|uniref:Uncharacterized protein n=1 Tax=Potamilus streckersoni TaxID=2493646 RepID=A0AAE0RRG4_9BIVA|nr:hypothetical protein CHS0354_004231 [Potamilus streckersoni]